MNWDILIWVGVLVLAGIIGGWLFAYFFHLTQKYLVKKSMKKLIEGQGLQDFFIPKRIEKGVGKMIGESVTLKDYCGFNDEKPKNHQTDL